MRRSLRTAGRNPQTCCTCEYSLHYVGIRTEEDSACHMIDRTEQTAYLHFVDFFAPMMMTDIPFWRYHVEHLSLQVGASLVTVNYFELLQTAFPTAYAACCKCRGNNKRRPCYEFTDLWSPCFRRHVSDVALAHFVVNDLGIFSVFGNEANQMPEGVLQANPRLAWVHNNAYRWSTHRTLRRCSEFCAAKDGMARAKGGGCPPCERSHPAATRYPSRMQRDILDRERWRRSPAALGPGQ